MVIQGRSTLIHLFVQPDDDDDDNNARLSDFLDSSLLILN